MKTNPLNEGVRLDRVVPLVHRGRHAGRSAAASRAGVAPFRNTAALGSAIGATRLQRAGVARFRDFTLSGKHPFDGQKRSMGSARILLCPPKHSAEVLSGGVERGVKRESGDVTDGLAVLNG